MKRVLFSLIFLIHLTLTGNPSIDSLLLGHKQIFVSLGSACEMASRIADYGFRCASFPFDWLLCLDVESVIQILENDFDLFLDETYFKPHPYHKDVIINGYYNIEFRHDWHDYIVPENNFWTHFLSYRKKLPEIEEKYQRRIRRFKELGHCKTKVFFVRSAIDFNVENRLINQVTLKQRRIDYSDAKRLENALRKLFPSLDFKLIIINFIEELPESFPNDDIITEFKFTRKTKESDYNRMFQTLTN